MKNAYKIAVNKLLNHRLMWLVIAVLFASSCTQEINLKLNNAGPQIVIEGNVYNTPGPYLVHISTSLPYYSTDSFPGVTGASVVIADNAGNTDTLHELTAGYYYTDSSYLGVPGRTYNLTIVSGGNKYTSTSTMPQPVAISSLTEQSLTVFTQSRIIVYCKFPDNAAAENYFRITTYQDSAQAVEDRVYSDQLTHGNVQQDIISTANNIQVGDTIQVILQAIDGGVYNYFNSLRTNTNSSSIAPANPISNISNNALGYFSACTYNEKTIIIP